MYRRSTEHGYRHKQACRCRCRHSEAATAAVVCLPCFLPVRRAQRLVFVSTCRGAGLLKSRMPQPLFLGLGTSNLRVPARLSVDESDSSVGGVAGGAYSPGQGPPCRPNNSRGKPPRPGWVPWQRHPSPLVGLCCCCVEGTCTCQPMNKKFTLSCTRWELRWNMKYLAPRSQPRRGPGNMSHSGIGTKHSYRPTKTR